MAIHPSAIIENRSILPDDADIRPMVYVADKVTIGRHVSIYHQSHISEGTIIEDDVVIANGVMTTNTRHITHGRKNMSRSGRQPITIKRGARIGAGSTILPGVTIGEECEIGAGSVVTKDTKPFGRYWGNPAIYHGDIQQDERW